MLSILMTVVGLKLSDAEASVDSDLPPVGRSYLDYFLYQNQGVPETFADFLARLRSRANDRPNARPGVLIPVGRSTQRFKTDFKFPRAVTSGNFDLPAQAADENDLIPTGQIYLAGAERAQQAEAISYNDHAGRFEFQIIRNYGRGLTPTVEYAHRAFCISCHQNEGPIFPLFPWSETNTTARAAAHMGKLLTGGNELYGMKVWEGLRVQLLGATVNTLSESEWSFPNDISDMFIRCRELLRSR